MKKYNVEHLETLSKADVEETLWRFISLDKFIDLLENKRLFLTSVQSFEHSDPHEGYLPKSIYQKYYEQFDAKLAETKSFIDDSYKKNVAKIHSSDLDENHKIQALDHLKKKSEEQSKRKHDLFIEKMFSLLAKSHTVSCWHANKYESEAMWKLYTDQGKGVAIKTTVGKLLSSIQKSSEAPPVYSKVIYCDFDSYSSDLQNSHVMPYKRKSFEHESERRIFKLNFNHDFLNNYLAAWFEYSGVIPIELNEDFDRRISASNEVPIDLVELIDDIVISPYSSEPFDSAVKTVINLFKQSDNSLKNLPEVKKSVLLTSYKIQR